MIDQAWKSDALCFTDRASLHFLFFPPNDGETKEDRESRIERAVEVCGACPVSSDCFDYAWRFKSEHGVWAGEEGSEIMRRRRLLKVLAAG